MDLVQASHSVCLEVQEKTELRIVNDDCLGNWISGPGELLCKKALIGMKSKRRKTIQQM